MLDTEKEAFGDSYRDSGWLVCHPDGRPVHPDTIIDRLNKLIDRAGVKRIRLHDVRHTYATTSLDAGVDPKIVADRIGHANMAYTLAIYTSRPGRIGRRPKPWLGCCSAPGGRATSATQSTSARPRMTRCAMPAGRRVRGVEPVDSLWGLTGGRVTNGHRHLRCSLGEPSPWRYWTSRTECWTRLVE